MVFSLISGGDVVVDGLRGIRENVGEGRLKASLRDTCDKLLRLYRREIRPFSYSP